MHVMFWVTSECNLACKYCYVDRVRERDHMTAEIADLAVNYTIKHFRELGEDDLLIGFHGGEPLLKFDLIKYIVNKLNNTAEFQNTKIQYAMTTNATLLDSEKMKYLIDHNVSLTMSIDGTPATHNQMRPFKNGKSSHSIALDNALKVQKQVQNLRIRMTFDPSTVDKLYEDVLYLVDKGFKTLVPAPNLFTQWTSSDLKTLKVQLRKINQHLKDTDDIRVGIIDNIPYRRKGLCRGGLSSFHISPAGEIYPCVLTVGVEEFIIGNVYEGIDRSKRNRFLELSPQKNEICEGCTLYHNCDGVRCKLINKIHTGDYFMPSGVECAIENMKYSIAKEDLIISGQHYTIPT